MGYLRWAAELEPFYKILLGLAFFTGIAALATGLATGNPVFLALGVIWLGGGVGVVRFAARREGV